MNVPDTGLAVQPPIMGWLWQAFQFEHGAQSEEGGVMRGVQAGARPGVASSGNPVGLASAMGSSLYQSSSSRSSGGEPSPR